MQGTETYKFKMKEKGVHLWTKTKSTPLYIYIFFKKKAKKVKQANFKFVKNPPDKRLLYKYFTEIVFFSTVFPNLQR